MWLPRLWIGVAGVSDFDACIPTQIPVFPLPECVLFPRQLLPLHVFEPRYRTMTREALCGDPYIAIALLKPGYEDSYLTNQAPIHRTVGVGKIVQSHELPEGRFNILLHGAARARIVAECDQRPYRVAQLELLEARRVDCCTRAAELRDKLQRQIRERLCCATELRDELLRLFETTLRIDEIADIVASVVPMVSALRQRLLEEPCVETRVGIVHDQVATFGRIASQERKPRFSFRCQN